MVSELSQTQKATHCLVPAMSDVQNRQVHRDRGGAVVAGAGEEAMGVTA